MFISMTLLPTMNASGEGRHGWAPTNSANLYGGGDGGVCLCCVCACVCVLCARVCVLCAMIHILRILTCVCASASSRNKSIDIDGMLHVSFGAML